MVAKLGSPWYKRKYQTTDPLKLEEPGKSWGPQVHLNIEAILTSYLKGRAALESVNSVMSSETHPAISVFCSTDLFCIA